MSQSGLPSPYASTSPEVQPNAELPAHGSRYSHHHSPSIDPALLSTPNSDYHSSYAAKHDSGTPLVDGSGRNCGYFNMYLPTSEGLKISRINPRIRTASGSEVYAIPSAQHGPPLRPAAVMTAPVPADLDLVSYQRFLNGLVMPLPAPIHFNPNLQSDLPDFTTSHGLWSATLNQEPLSDLIDDHPQDQDVLYDPAHLEQASNVAQSLPGSFEIPNANTIYSVPPYPPNRYGLSHVVQCDERPVMDPHLGISIDLPPSPEQPLQMPGRLGRSSTIDSVPCSEKGCTRRFRPKQPGTRLCRRHQQKYDRNHAAPPIFAFPAGIVDFYDAKSRIYPRQVPLSVDGERLTQELCQQFANTIVESFVQAASTPYVEGSGYHEFHERQQKVFNGKGFKDEEVNVRMRFLYQAVIVLHTGGETVYPEGGDNGGYGRPDKTLKFNDRVHRIVEILKLDKRVCMDVIEGRGVTAFVANPDKFEKRKTQNKDSNERKQRKQQLGDKVQAKRKAKGKVVEESDVDSEDESGAGEEDDGGGEGGVALEASVWHTPQSMLLEYTTGNTTSAQPLLDVPAAGTRKRKRAADTAAAATGSKKMKATPAIQQATPELEPHGVHHFMGGLPVPDAGHPTYALLPSFQGTHETSHPAAGGYDGWEGRKFRAFDLEYDDVFERPWG